MVIIETSVFTRVIDQLLGAEDYRLLQQELVIFPARGPVIRGTGGLRKLRWDAPGRGKRGGIRVIYYWAVSDDQILMLYAYAKNSQADLTPEQERRLAAIVRQEYP